MAENTILLSVGTAGVMSIAAAVTALKGLDTVLKSISQGVKEAFTIQGHRDYLQTVSRFGKKLASQLLTLQMAFGRLKIAIAQAFAPLLEIVVPYINQAIFAIIRFAGVVRQFLTGLITAVRGHDSLSESAENAADAENDLAKAATSAGKAAKRSLMGLDQLERLNEPTGGGGSSGYSFPKFDDFVSPVIMRDVNRFLTFLESLPTIDLTPLRTALQGLREAWQSLMALVGSTLQWLWNEMLFPFMTWATETFAPALTNALASGLQLVTALIEPVILGMQSLWQALQPVATFIEETVVTVLQSFQGAFESLWQAFKEKGPQITGMFQHIGAVMDVVWRGIEPILWALRQHVSDTCGDIAAILGDMAQGCMYVLDGILRFLAGGFTNDWCMIWDGIQNYLRGIIQLITGLLNAMIRGFVTSINSIIKAVNRLSFKVPDWIPGIGGENFGFNLKTVTAPQIPYLAQGAVLPANKPFLAMVGDQRHGTNVEAPLTTIQEAVASVMGDQTAAILAGFEASVGVQREILEAVLGIRIGDDVIGSAAARYSRKQAVLRGGAL